MNSGCARRGADRIFLKNSPYAERVEEARERFWLAGQKIHLIPICFCVRSVENTQLLRAGFLDGGGMSGYVKKEILTVTQLSQALKMHIETRFPAIAVQGEVSNLKEQASGHLYFTLKDAQAQISAVLFKTNG